MSIDVDARHKLPPMANGWSASDTCTIRGSRYEHQMLTLLTNTLIHSSLRMRPMSPRIPSSKRTHHTSEGDLEDFVPTYLSSTSQQRTCTRAVLSTFHSADEHDSILLADMEPGSPAWIEMHSAHSTTTERPRGLPYVSSRLPHDHSQGKSHPSQPDPLYSTLNGASTELDPDLQARQLRARERLEILRGRVFRTRHIVRGKRDEVRQLRKAAVEAGDKLTRKISEIVALADTEALRSVAPYYEKMRNAQDALGPKDEEYCQLERRLDDEEQDLEQEEDHFYRHNHVLNITIEDSKLDQAISPLVKPYEPPDPELQDLQLDHDLVKAYLRRIVEAEQLKDELDELEDTYYRRTMDFSFRKHHNVPISAETTSFLQDYPEIHADALDILHDIEDDIFDLRDQCLQQNLFAESEHVYEARDTLCDEWMESVEEAHERSPLRAAARLLDYPEQTRDFDDKRECVNKWLLRWVQDSPYETLRLRTFILLEYPHDTEKLKDGKWPQLALENWDSDGAGESATASFQASRMDTITGEALTARRTGLSYTISDMGSLEVDFDENASDESNVGDFASQKYQLETTERRIRSHSAPPMLTGSIAI